MWLPKDERKLLRGYYKILGEPGKFEAYVESDLESLLGPRPKYDNIPRYGQRRTHTEPKAPFDRERAKREIVEAVEIDQRFHVANRNLEDRGLIEVKRHQTLHQVILVSVTLNGYDLGRKLCNRWATLELWIQNNRYVFWLILTVLGVVIAALVFLTALL